jgi:hypothetical protein
MKNTLLCFVVFAAGCGSNTGDVDQFIQNVATQQCQWEFRCCTDPEIGELDGHKFTNMDDCVPYRQLQLQDQWYLDRLAASEGRLRVDPARAAACLDQMHQQSCNPKPGMPAMMTNPMQMDACASVLVGATPVGKECVYTHECVDGARCVGDTDAVGRGVCVPYQHEGDICNVDADCDPQVKDLYCAKKDYHCHVRAGLGGACAVDTTVSPAVALLECEPSSVGNVYCDPDASVCKQLPGDGQPCLGDPLPAGVTSRCDPDPALELSCDSSGSTGPGTCRGPAKLGDDCSQRACARPYFCNPQTSVCDQPAAAGEDCSGKPCDTGLYCRSTDRVCHAQLPDGAACTGSPGDECQSGQCSTGGAHGALLACQPRTGMAACSGRN